MTSKTCDAEHTFSCGSIASGTMKCPFDDSPLQVVNRSGVEIDWCPTCKGVWLERGELDKLIEQASAADAAPVRAAAVPSPPPPPARDDRRRPDGDWDDDWDDSSRGSRHDDRYDDRHDGGSYGKKRRGSFLSEIFDF
jgi:uncharacterized protein